MRVLRRKLATFAGLSPGVLILLLPAWLMIGSAAVAIRIVAFRHLARLAGTNAGAVSFTPLATRTQIARALRIRQAIMIAAKYAPFRSDCFPQAIAAAMLCRLLRVPYAMHFGVAFDGPAGAAGRDLVAHAWMVTGSVTLTGGRGFGGFTAVSCFAWPLPITITSAGTGR